MNPKAIKILLISTALIILIVGLFLKQDGQIEDSKPTIHKEITTELVNDTFLVHTTFKNIGTKPAVMVRYILTAEYNNKTVKLMSIIIPELDSGEVYLLTYRDLITTNLNGETYVHIPETQDEVKLNKKYRLQTKG